MFTCNGILNFVKVVTKCNLSGNVSDRVACCLDASADRTAHTRFNFDNRIVKAFRIKCKLYVTTTLISIELIISIAALRNI